MGNLKDILMQRAMAGGMPMTGQPTGDQSWISNLMAGAGKPQMGGQPRMGNIMGAQKPMAPETPINY